MKITDLTIDDFNDLNNVLILSREVLAFSDKEKERLEKLQNKVLEIMFESKNWFSEGEESK